MKKPGITSGNSNISPDELKEKIDNQDPVVLQRRAESSGRESTGVPKYSARNMTDGILAWGRMKYPVVKNG